MSRSMIVVKLEGPEGAVAASVGVRADGTWTCREGDLAGAQEGVWLVNTEGLELDNADAAQLAMCAGLGSFDACKRGDRGTLRSASRGDGTWTVTETVDVDD